MMGEEKRIGTVREGEPNPVCESDRGRALRLFKRMIRFFLTGMAVMAVVGLTCVVLSCAGLADGKWLLKAVEAVCFIWTAAGIYFYTAGLFAGDRFDPDRGGADDPECRELYETCVRAGNVIIVFSVIGVVVAGMAARLFFVNG